MDLPITLPTPDLSFCDGVDCGDVPTGASGSTTAYTSATGVSGGNVVS